jgi:hypothetical protein
MKNYRVSLIRVVVSVVVMAILFRSSSGYANVEKIDCAKTAEDLRGMQEAQRQILTSLSKQNQSLAGTLDQHADVLDKKMNRSGKVKKTDIQVIHRSAQSFRLYGEKEQNLVRKYEKASNELLSKVQICLSSAANNQSLEKLGQR